MRRTGRYFAAWAVIALLFVLHWNFWMAGAVQPIILGMPVQFLYHVIYLLASVAAIWFLFSTIWPDTPRDF